MTEKKEMGLNEARVNSPYRTASQCTMRCPILGYTRLYSKSPAQADCVTVNVDSTQVPWEG